MAKICYVFSGQGGQSAGMGKDLYDANVEARAAFDEIDAALGKKLSEIMFEGPVEELSRPENVQPAIFAVSMAIWRAGSMDRVAADNYVAGHSLGEYSALTASGAVDMADAARLIRRRGELMQAAVAPGVGAMGAIVGSADGLCSAASIEAICSEASAAAGGVCEFANDNGGGQVVVSGNRTAVEKAMEIAKAKGAKIAKILPVPGCPHCSLMESAAAEFRAEIDKIAWTAPECGFISNKTAAVMRDISEIKDALVYQLTHGVRWRECVLAMPSLGISEVVEVGPGNVLTGLVGRILPDLKAHKLGE